MSISRTSVIEALASGKPEALLGLAETVWLDFKVAPYSIKNDRGKFELSKDVAAFANSQGGLLVLGVRAKKEPDRAQEIAHELCPFPQQTVDLDRYIDTLAEYLRPPVEIKPHWFPHPDSTDSYLVIEVEPVLETARYVIVRRMINDKDAFTEGLAIPVRHQDRTIFLPSEDVYSLMNEGVRARLMPREAPQTIINYGTATVHTGSPQVQEPDLVDESINEMERMQDWGDLPMLYLQSIPTSQRGVLHDLYGANGLEGALRNQNVLRPDGFNFADRTGQLRVLGGGFYLNRTRFALWVRPNGLVTAGLPATTEMLCWAMEQSSRPERLNVFVLTEMILEYFRIVDELVGPRLPGPMKHRVLAQRFQGERPRLLGAGLSPLHMMISEARPASADTWDQSWPSVGDPERDAYEALRNIYALFGMDVNVNRDVENHRISVSKFRPDPAE